MRQRHLIDVSTMEDERTTHRSPSRPGSKSRRSSKRGSVSSCVTPGRSQSLSIDFRPNASSRSASTPRSSTYDQLALTPNGRPLEISLPSNGGSRLNSGVSRVTLSSRSTARSRGKMTSTSSSFRTTTTVCSKSSSFPDSIGTQPGMTIWVLENRRLVQISHNCHGFFHQGNGYLILKIQSQDTKYIHVWLGAKSDQVDRDALLSHAEKLDKQIEGANFLSLENERHETASFLEHFQDGFVIMGGKSKTSLRSATAYNKKLYLVRGRRFPIATCMTCRLSALAPDRALILDGFPRIYVWFGPEVDNVTRVKVIQVAHKMRDRQRKGIAHITVIDKKDTALHEAFIRKLDAEGDDDEELPLGEEDQFNARLYRINGDRPMYDMPFVAEKPFQHKYLTSKNCFLLDRGANQPVFIWIGASADPSALWSAFKRAQLFTHHYNYPIKTAVCRVTEGDEPPCFKFAFSDWCDRTTKQRQLIRSYNVANIGRAIYSSSDCRTIAQMSELWSDDQFVTGDGVTEVWRICNTTLQARVWEQPGIFNNCHSYVVLYQESSGDGNKNIVYYWLGCKSSKESHRAAVEMVTALDRALEHKASMIRVLDGSEPKHFLTIFQYSMLVYDGDLANEESDSYDDKSDTTTKEEQSSDRGNDNSFQDEEENQKGSCSSDQVNVFRVREIVPGCMRVLQVPALSSSLNSSAAYIAYSNTYAFVWYGKNANANEREYSKSMLDNLCPDRLYQYDIVSEGREPNKFWDLFTSDGEYATEFPKQVIHRRLPRLFLFIESSCTFWTVEQFAQEDLNETDLYILDTFDQLFIWCGRDFETKNCEIFLSICESFLDIDLAGRHINDTEIWFVNQGFEPDVFSKHFPTWDEFGYGGVLAYEAARKWARQENAVIDIDCQMVDRTYTYAVKLPFKELVKTNQDDNNIDILHKEHHLTDKEFNRVLRMSRAQFYRLPEWKQTQILRSSHLQRASCDDMSPGWSVGSASSRISLDLSSIMKKKIQTSTSRQLDR